MPKNFWSNFEEPAVASEAASMATKTAQREEPDQRNTELAMGTTTATAAREEDDQDPKQAGFHAVPVVSTTGTKTETRAREETDQDVAVSFHLHGHGSPATMTMTEQRKELDQDKALDGYPAIPRSTGVPS